LVAVVVAVAVLVMVVGGKGCVLVRDELRYDAALVAGSVVSVLVLVGMAMDAAEDGDEALMRACCEVRGHLVCGGAIIVVVFERAGGAAEQFDGHVFGVMWRLTPEALRGVCVERLLHFEVGPGDAG
jgi:hypothetical protein